jgi:hypothetical protein
MVLFLVLNVLNLLRKLIALLHSFIKLLREVSMRLFVSTGLTLVILLATIRVIPMALVSVVGIHRPRILSTEVTVFLFLAFLALPPP